MSLLPRVAKETQLLAIALGLLTYAATAGAAPQGPRKRNLISLGVPVVYWGELQAMDDAHSFSGPMKGSPGIGLSYAFKPSRFFALGLELDYLALFSVDRDAAWFGDATRFHYGELLRVPLVVELIWPLHHDRLELYYKTGGGFAVRWQLRSHPGDNNDLDKNTSIGWTVTGTLGARYWLWERFALFFEPLVFDFGIFEREIAAYPYTQWLLISGLSVGATARF